jgi:hypothetical protein
MSALVMQNVRGYLISSSAVTSYVDTANIKVGWQKEFAQFPTIVLSQGLGQDYGQTGYAQSPSGSRIRREIVNVNIDVLSRTSMYHTYQIADSIIPIMIYNAFRKVQDVDLFDDDKMIHRKFMSFRLSQEHSD